MIELTRGNLLTADVEAVVNTVNCVGYMGKGIALQFKQAFPENFAAYQQACARGEVRPGRMFVFETRLLHGPKCIINFPTKRHWRGRSRLEDIRDGLVALVEEIRTRNIRSIAVPPLGCGNGRLDWRVVRPLIEAALRPLESVRVVLYEPAGAPEARSMPVRTAPPGMTVARALFVQVMNQYLTLSYRLTLLEIQKLAYFLQEAGEPLRLRYEAGLYGPFAANLNKVLERIEGHFIRGYGDSQKPDAEIELMGDAVGKAGDFLADHPQSRSRLEEVARLIEGFETPYGMELLSSVHWVATHDSPRATTAGEALRAVHRWNDRKRRMFSPDRIELAWDRLREAGWLSR